MTTGQPSFEPFVASDPRLTESTNGHTAAPSAPSAAGRLATCWAVGTAGPGAPGVTTLAVACATQAGGVLVEADPDGGVVGLRYGCWLHESAPSLASLLACLRPGVSPAAVDDHIQQLPAGARAVLLAPVAEEALGPVEHLDEHLESLRTLLCGDRLVLDVGRLRPASPALRLVRHADGLVVVTWPSVEALACLLARLPRLLEQTSRVVVAVRGQGPYRFADIQAEVHARAGRVLPVLAVPEDPRGVARLGSHPRRGNRSGRWGRSPLMHAAAQLPGLLAESPAGQPPGRDRRSSAAGRGQTRRGRR